MKKALFVVIVLGIIVAGAVLISQKKAEPLGQGTAEKTNATKERGNRDVNKIDPAAAITTEKNGITEISLPNPPEIASRPSIDELKEFRKKSEELKKNVEDIKTQRKEGGLTVGINNAVVPVEPLYTFEDQTKGLLGRDSLPKDAGMLYVFQMDDAGRLFGTKGMKFSIDLIWLNSDSTVVHIHKNVPPDFDGALKSMWPARFVLEANAGYADSYEIRVGDTIDISKIPH